MYQNIDDDKGKKNNKDTRAVRFCLGMSKWWNNPVHANIERMTEQTWTHMASTNVNVIPQVFQYPRNFRRRSKPETYGWNHIS
jgi:hypothetical protein